MRGSQHNDPYCIKDGKVMTETNHCGGIIGGITTGMPIVFRTAFKPTASIGIEQKTVSLSEMKETVIKIGGRHDPCIAIRALPCIESITAAVLADLMISKDGTL
jgi:chorismate synthase